MATTTPLFGWSVPTSSDLVKNGATAIETLGDSIDASMGDLLGGTTGQVLAKASNTDMDFTWTTAASGGGMTLLSTTTLTSTGVTISSISGSYKHLFLMLNNVVGSASSEVYIRFNGDTSTAYGESYINNIAGTISGAAASRNSTFIGNTSTNTDWSNKFSGEMWVWRYTDTSQISYSISTRGYNGSGKTQRQLECEYNASAAITSIIIGLDTGTFSSGTAYLYGVN
jgi:hypothetical protein